jgi:hypothetical protein
MNYFSCSLVYHTLLVYESDPLLSSVFSWLNTADGVIARDRETPWQSQLLAVEKEERRLCKRNPGPFLLPQPDSYVL